MQKKNVKAVEQKAVDTVKTVAKEVEAKAEAVKPVAKEVEKKAEEVVKKTASTAKKTASAAKKTVAKKAAAKEPVKAQVNLQYQNNEIDLAKIEERVKAQFVAEGHKAGTIKKLNIYVKPEEYSAYYVINEKFSGRVDLF